MSSEIALEKDEKEKQRKGGERRERGQNKFDHPISVLLYFLLKSAVTKVFETITTGCVQLLSVTHLEQKMRYRHNTAGI